MGYEWIFQTSTQVPPDALNVSMRQIISDICITAPYMYVGLNSSGYIRNWKGLMEGLGKGKEEIEELNGKKSEEILQALFQCYTTLEDLLRDLKKIDFFARLEDEGHLDAFLIGCSRDISAHR